jgi:hypothetical protein
MTETFLKGRAGRRLAVAVLCLAPLAIALPGCKLFRKAKLESTVNTSNPHTADQLVDGFYGVEAAAWRWTARHFVVKLKTPAGAAQKGGSLRLVLTVPSSSIDRLGPITLNAKVPGAAFAPETYSTTGTYTYRRDVPASALTGNDVNVEFDLDKSFSPDGVDKRDLGVIVTTIGLDSK